MSKLHDIVLIRKMQKTKRYTFNVTNAIYIPDGSNPMQIHNSDLQSPYRVFSLYLFLHKMKFHVQGGIHVKQIIVLPC